MLIGVYKFPKFNFLKPYTYVDTLVVVLVLLFVKVVGIFKGVRTNIR